MRKPYPNFLRLVAMHLEFNENPNIERQTIVESIKSACTFMSVCKDSESVLFLEMVNNVMRSPKINYFPLHHSFLENKTTFPLFGEVLEGHYYHFFYRYELSNALYKLSEIPF
jgi:hypothetical protein